MKPLLIPGFLLLPLFASAQLDTLKGKVKWVKDSITYTDKSYFILSLREVDFGQLAISEEDLFMEFKGDLLPKRSVHFNKEREFDSGGKLVALHRISPKMDSRFSTFFQYDDKDRIVQRRDISSNGHTSTINYRFEHVDGLNERLAAQFEYESDHDRFSMKQFFYDRSGLLREIREWSANRWDTKENFCYDNVGRVIMKNYSRLEKVLTFDPIMKIETYKDSIVGYFIEFISYYPDGTLKEKYSGCGENQLKGYCQRTYYFYDDCNRPTKTLYYWRGMDSLFSRREYEYYPDNNLKRIACYYKEATEPTSSADYFYTDNEISKVILTQNEKITVFEFLYQLDQHKNWIEQKKLVNGELFYTRTRTILYW